LLRPLHSIAEDRGAVGDVGDVDLEEEAQKNIFEKWMDKMDMEDHDIQVGHM
jgi:hypothetical protein